MLFIQNTYNPPTTPKDCTTSNFHPPMKEYGQAKPEKMPALMFSISAGRVISSNFTVDKAPLQVDNSIKQVDNASLQRRFELKQRHQKSLQRGFTPKQSGFASLHRRLLIKQVG